MNKQPFVSIVIANHNGRKLIEDCLGSLFRIDYPKDRFEIIVVDNSSQDDSVKFIKAKYRDVKVIENEVNNYCQACNRGILMSKGDYVALLNNDVKVDKEWLAELVKIMENDNSIGAITSKLLKEDGTIQNAGLYELPNFYWDERGAGKKAEEYGLITEVDAISGACVLYRRVALNQIGLLDEDFVMFGEDVDISLRLKKKGRRLVYAPSSIAYHKVHGSCDEGFAREAIEKNRLLLVAKHYPHKLAIALVGSGHFIINKDNLNSGQIFDLMPKVLLKLTKHYDTKVIEEVVRDLFFEFKRIVNYENKKLEDDLKSILNDLIETKKDREHYKDNEWHYHNEIETLSTRLKESLDSGLAKDNTISEIGHQLSEYKQEVNILSARLKESLDSGLAKDNTISEIGHQLSEYKQEVNILSARLKESLDVRLKLEDELSAIYNSEGFRFVLNPLWKIIWYSRLIFNFSIMRICDFIWAVGIIFICPLILLQILFFLFERITEILFGEFSTYFRRERDIVPFDKLTVSVVIPDWNGIELLRKCLSSIYEADGFKDGNYEILVVDDASSYSVAESIKDEFPKVRVIRNRRNQGFGRTCNKGVREAKGELIILLNNDIMVSPDFFGPLKEHFKDDNVFAVAPKLYYWDKETFNYGMHMGKFKDGYLALWNESETGNGDRVSQTAPSIFAVGGAMCFRKRDFLWLGGFDDIYRPNCWEDIDISYRAQKRGLKVLYEPKSLVFHKGGATLNYVRHKEIKNELLFMWKNINDNKMLLSHFIHLPKFFYCGRHSNKITFLAGYFWAFNHLIPALINRFREKKYTKIGDNRVLNKCMLYYRNFMRNNYIHPEKKTVLLVTPFMIYPLNCGGKLRIYNLYKRLSKKYNLILLSLVHNENEEKYNFHLKEIFSEVYTIHTKTPAEEFFFPRQYKFSFSSFLIEKLKDIQDNRTIDIIHIESNELLYLTKYIKYIPVIYTEHDISILSYYNSYYNKGLQDSIFRFIDYLKLVCYHDKVYRRIDRVIALSEEDKRVVNAFSPQTGCSLIPTGVDLEHFVFSQKTGIKKSLIFVGHYPHYPNTEAAVYFCRHIFPLIRNAIPGATLKLVGSCPTEEVIKLSKIKGVEVIGAVSDVNPHLQDASVFVTAFRKSAGIKGKVLEAMATGTPVVSTTRGACGIDAINGKHILIADRPDDFAKDVIELLQNGELYGKLAYNARLLVEEKYDWEKMAEQLDKVYRDVMEEDKPKQITAVSKAEEETTVVSSAARKEKAVSSRTPVQDIIEKTDKIVGLSLDCLGKDNDKAVNPNPEELHIELTHMCNSKCVACDIWDYHYRNNKSINDELTLDEIRNFIGKSKRLKEVKTVVLSGGEPFLRPDFIDICISIKNTLPKARLGILTNGINTETIISKTKNILERFNSGSLYIGSSLDGLGDVYDKMRGVRGGFDSFIKTVERFKKELPDISFSATFVLTPFNMHQLIPCWDFADKNGLDFFAQFAVPKQARSPEVFQWEEGDFIKIKEYVTQIIEKMACKAFDLEIFSNSLIKVSDKINLLTKIYYWSHLVDFQQNGKGFFRNCGAAFKFAMFDPYGNMFFCPLLKDKIIGNVRNGSIDELWISEKADKIRDFINCGKCSCWLVCTVFPVVGRALVLYGDKVAANLLSDNNASAMLRENKLTSGGSDRIPVSIQDKKSNLELNNEEFREKKIILQSSPQGITVGANYKCNANCVFCLGGEYRPFTLELYKNYFEPRLGDMIKQADYVSFCGIGELLLIPEIRIFLEYINKTLPNKNKILTTNGFALSNSLSDLVTGSNYSIQVSLHASNAGLHERITGMKGGFAKIIEQIRHILARRKNKQSPYISLIFLVNTTNIEDLPNFVELAASLGVDSVRCNYLTIFEPAHLKLSCFFMQELTNEIFAKAMQRAQDLNIELTLPPKFAAGDYFKTMCPAPWKNIQVDTEGVVLPCCYSGEHFGELSANEIFSIWNNNKYRQMRSDLVSGESTGICKYCLNSNPANVNLLNSHVTFRPETQKLILNCAV